MGRLTNEKASKAHEDDTRENSEKITTKEKRDANSKKTVC